MDREKRKINAAFTSDEIDQGSPPTKIVATNLSSSISDNTPSKEAANSLNLMSIISDTESISTDIESLPSSSQKKPKESEDKSYLEKRIAELENENNKLKSNEKFTKFLLEDEKTQRKKLEKEKSSLEKNIKELDEKYGNLSQENSQLRQHLLKTLEGNDALSKANNSLSKECKKLTSNNNSLQEENEELKNKINKEADKSRYLTYGIVSGNFPTIFDKYFGNSRNNPDFIKLVAAVKSYCDIDPSESKAEEFREMNKCRKIIEEHKKRTRPSSSATEPKVKKLKESELNNSV